jgi:sensor domain CHASE-containing protein
MPRCKIFLWILALALTLTACGGKATYLDNRDVRLVEEELEEKNGQVILYLGFRNSDSDEINHSVYRVDWMDDKGRVIESTSWRPIIVKGGATVRAIERSTVPGVTDCRVQISNNAS